MLKVKCEGKERILEWTELRDCLNDSGLPWFINQNQKDINIYIVGYNQDLIIEGEICTAESLQSV